MATALDIINDAVRELGVYGAGETVSGDDSGMCLDALNDVLESLRLESLMLFETEEVIGTLPANTASLTIGDGEDFDIANRPVRIEAGSFVRVNGLDYPLDVVSKEDYNEITLKTVEGPWPRVCVYDAAYPIGTLTFFPLGACAVHLQVATILESFANVAATVTLPPGYKRTLGLLLAEDIAPKFQVNLRSDTVRKISVARRNIKRANLKVPELKIGKDESLPARYAILGG